MRDCGNGDGDGDGTVVMETVMEKGKEEEFPKHTYLWDGQIRPFLITSFHPPFLFSPLFLSSPFLSPSCLFISLLHSFSVLSSFLLPSLRGVNIFENLKGL